MKRYFDNKNTINQKYSKNKIDQVSKSLIENKKAFRNKSAENINNLLNRDLELISIEEQNDRNMNLFDL